MQTLALKLALMAAVAAVVLFFGAKFARVRMPAGSVLVIAVVSSLLSAIPYAGWPLSAYFMLRLNSRLSDADLFPDAAIVTVIGIAPLWLLRFALL